MRIATWNINSVRLRLPQVLRFIKEQNIDVMCLQETKTPDEHFPKKEFDEVSSKIKDVDYQKTTESLKKNPKAFSFF